MQHGTHISLFSLHLVHGVIDVIYPCMLCTYLNACRMSREIGIPWKVSGRPRVCSSAGHHPAGFDFRDDFAISPRQLEPQTKSQLLILRSVECQHGETVWFRHVSETLAVGTIASSTSGIAIGMLKKIKLNSLYLNCCCCCCCCRHRRRSCCCCCRRCRRRRCSCC